MPTLQEIYDMYNPSTYDKEQDSSYLSGFAQLFAGGQPTRATYKALNWLPDVVNPFDKEGDHVVWKPWAGALWTTLWSNFTSPDLRAYQSGDDLSMAIGSMAGLALSIPGEILEKTLGRGVEYGLSKVISKEAAQLLGHATAVGSNFALMDMNKQAIDQLRSGGANSIPDAYLGLDWGEAAKNFGIGAGSTYLSGQLLKAYEGTKTFQTLSDIIYRDSKLNLPSVGASVGNLAIQNTLGTMGYIPFFIDSATSTQDLINLLESSMVVGIGTGAWSGAWNNIDKYKLSKNVADWYIDKYPDSAKAMRLPQLRDWFDLRERGGIATSLARMSTVAVHDLSKEFEKTFNDTTGGDYQQYAKAHSDTVLFQTLNNLDRPALDNGEIKLFSQPEGTPERFRDVTLPMVRNFIDGVRGGTIGSPEGWTDENLNTLDNWHKQMTDQVGAPQDTGRITNRDQYYELMKERRFKGAINDPSLVNVPEPVFEQYVKAQWDNMEMLKPLLVRHAELGKDQLQRALNNKYQPANTWADMSEMISSAQDLYVKNNDQVNTFIGKDWTTGPIYDQLRKGVDGIDKINTIQRSLLKNDYLTKDALDPKGNIRNLLVDDVNLSEKERQKVSQYNRYIDQLSKYQDFLGQYTGSPVDLVGQIGTDKLNVTTVKNDIMTKVSGINLDDRQMKLQFFDDFLKNFGMRFISRRSLKTGEYISFLDKLMSSYTSFKNVDDSIKTNLASMDERVSKIKDFHTQLQLIGQQMKVLGEKGAEGLKQYAGKEISGLRDDLLGVMKNMDSHTTVLMQELVNLNDNLRAKGSIPDENLVQNQKTLQDLGVEIQGTKNALQFGTKGKLWDTIGTLASGKRNEIRGLLRDTVDEVKKEISSAFHGSYVPGEIGDLIKSGVVTKDKADTLGPTEKAVLSKKGTKKEWKKGATPEEQTQIDEWTKQHEKDLFQLESKAGGLTETYQKTKIPIKIDVIEDNLFNGKKFVKVSTRLNLDKEMTGKIETEVEKRILNRILPELDALPGSVKRLQNLKDLIEEQGVKFPDEQNKRITELFDKGTKKGLSPDEYKEVVSIFDDYMKNSLNVLDENQSAIRRNILKGLGIDSSELLDKLNSDFKLSGLADRVYSQFNKVLKVSKAYDPAQMDAMTGAVKNVGELSRNLVSLLEKFDTKKVSDHLNKFLGATESVIGSWNNRFKDLETLNKKGLAEAGATGKQSDIIRKKINGYIKQLGMNPYDMLDIPAHMSNIIDSVKGVIRDRAHEYVQTKEDIQNQMMVVAHEMDKRQRLYVPHLYEQDQLDDYTKKMVLRRLGLTVNKVSDVKSLMERTDLSDDTLHRLKLITDPVYAYAINNIRFEREFIKLDNLRYMLTQYPKEFSDTPTDVHKNQLSAEVTGVGIPRWGVLSGKYTTDWMNDRLQNTEAIWNKSENKVRGWNRRLMTWWQGVKTFGSMFTGIRNYMTQVEMMWMDNISRETKAQTHEMIRGMKDEDWRFLMERKLVSGSGKGYDPDLFADSHDVMENIDKALKNSLEQPFVRALGWAQGWAGKIADTVDKSCNAFYYPAKVVNRMLHEAKVSNTKLGVFERLKNAFSVDDFDKLSMEAKRWYGASHDWFRLVYYNDSMNYLKNFPEYKDNPEKLKLDAIEMAKARMPASFDAPQGLKDLSRFKPFLSWTWSAAGIVAKKVLTHPDKIMQFVGMLGMMESMAYAQYGDNLRKDEKEHSMGFGDWLKDMFLVRLPISWTQDGKFSLGPDAQAKTYLDLTWFAPFMDLQAQEGALIPTPFVTNPVLTSAMGIYSGKDPILGTTLVNPWDDGYIKLGKTLGYLNKQFLWNLSPGSAEILNWYDKTFGVGDVRDSGLYKVLANLRSGSQFKRLFEDFSGTGSAAKAPFGARMLRSGLGVPVQILPSEQIAKNMAMYIGEKKKEAGSAVAKVTRMYSKGDIVFDQYKQYVDMIHEQLVHDLMINPD